MNYVMMKNFIWFLLINIWWLSCFFNFILSLFFVNSPQPLDVKPGCLKCISDMNLSPANKKLLTISFILYWLVNTSKTIEDQLKEFYWNISLFLNYLIILLVLAVQNILIFYYRTLHILIKALFFRYLYLQILHFYLLYYFYTWKRNWRRKTLINWLSF